MDAALEIIRADLRRDDEVTHEHAVEFALVVASANDTASEQSPIDLRRSVEVRTFARDQIADESDGLGVDRPSPIMGGTKSAAESENIGAHEQQSRNVRRFERTRQAAHQLEIAALRTEIVKPHDIEMRDEAAAGLVPRVEHRALKSERRKSGEKSEVGLLVREHHADQADFVREPLQGSLEPIERRSVHSELDVVDALGRDRPDVREQHFFLVGRIAERRADLASSRDSGSRLAYGIERNGSEGAAPRVLQIDDVGAELERDVGLLGIDDAGQHAGHRAGSQTIAAPISSRACSWGTAGLRRRRRGEAA